MEGGTPDVKDRHELYETNQFIYQRALYHTGKNKLLSITNEIWSSYVLIQTKYAVLCVKRNHGEVFGRRYANVKVAMNGMKTNIPQRANIATLPT